MPYQNEFAKGESLSRLVENPSVRDFQGMIKCVAEQESSALPARLEPQRFPNRISRVIAIDGSTVTHKVLNGYPGAEAALFNLAAIVIDVKKLRDIPRNYIPGPKEIRDMEQVHTLSAVLPGRNVIRRDRELSDSPKRFFRATVNNELDAKLDPEHESLIETFRAITIDRIGEITCPIDDCPLRTKGKITPRCGVSQCNCEKAEPIYETDSLRAHERFEEYGSSEEAFTAFRQIVEHLAIVNILRYFEQRNSLRIFDDTAFIMDGPLALFGMPAWLKHHIGEEVTRLHKKSLDAGGNGILLMGVEKSGQFLDHLEKIDWKEGQGPRAGVSNSTLLTPDIQYIHRHIVLRPPDSKPYGDATYYGRKVLYKNSTGHHSVIVMPIVNEKGRDYNCTEEAAYPRIGEALDIMDELSTYLYRDGFTPLVRAHAHAAIPLRKGARILEKILRER